MKFVGEEEVLNNFNFWRRANIISSINSKCTIVNIADKVGDSIHNSYFAKLMKFLEERGFIKINRKKAPYIVTIDGKKLSWFLRENSEVFKQFELNTKIRMGLKPYYIG